MLAYNNCNADISSLITEISSRQNNNNDNSYITEPNISEGTVFTYGGKYYFIADKTYTFKNNMITDENGKTYNNKTTYYWSQC